MMPDRARPAHVILNLTSIFTINFNFRLNISTVLLFSKVVVTTCSRTPTVSLDINSSPGQTLLPQSAYSLVRIGYATRDRKPGSTRVNCGASRRESYDARRDDSSRSTMHYHYCFSFLQRDNTHHRSLKSRISFGSSTSRNTTVFLLLFVTRIVFV
jgi:hypothetical protein